jgi:two-component system, chemotaxis family, CheB/CheR fusion protein
VLKLRGSRSHKRLTASAAGSPRPRDSGTGHGGALRAKPVPSTAEGQLKGLTVLVIEDDSDARYIFRKMLKLEGALVLEAAEGVAALELCSSDARIDVILCDLLMPWLDGYGFLRGLRSLRKRRHVPVIAVSALSQDRDYLRTYNTGFARHLTKPVDFDVLTRTILSVAGRSSA